MGHELIQDLAKDRGTRPPCPGKLGSERGVAFADIVIEVKRTELALPGERVDKDQAAVCALENSGRGLRQDETSPSVATHQTSPQRPRGVH